MEGIEILILVNMDKSDEQGYILWASVLNFFETNSLATCIPLSH